MECKGAGDYKKHELHAGDLIDTLWNVKMRNLKADMEAGKDLIDTLWNVKNQAVAIRNFRDSDLIDTLWNVKVLVDNGKHDLYAI